MGSPEETQAQAEVDVVVIGAGQAGLSSAYHLRRDGWAPGTGFVVLDADPLPGGAWRHRPSTLTMAKVHGIFDLPGSRFGTAGSDDGRDDADGTDPGVSRPVAEVVADYFAAYERRNALPVLRPVRVDSVREFGDRLVVAAGDREWAARAVINATGTWRRPYWPAYPGAAGFAGRQLHSASYRGPAEFAGRRVVVVGGGNSAAQILSEIADVAAATTWVTRRPPVFRDGFTREDGRAAVARVEERVRAGLPPQSVVSVTGLAYTTVVKEALRKGVLTRLPMFERIRPDGVVWPDGAFVPADVIVWATGFRPDLGHLAPLRLREPGGGIAMDGTRVVAQPRLHLVGYGPSASTVGANRAGRAAAREVARLLATELPVADQDAG
ncbi:Predicted flavoprotein CzcO associated with the cation diffusion facilitator CzcD [Actinopolymorpha cephalotaxi]|uniref:Cation diffusion facilitator CzcD-associated flavoprotein CzcO n=1 Tax=Actinopolymorpha cephalotaxi TaxID=504797 RepID=A0A1I2MSJ3_9ACTN|nr:FAD-dependent oxidoreductase [Actinopolymorpha cephalotaxi]NYH85879.1 cation diffusion facilitator CzcD-associated flavoprotein CzcO [Actinopolymorpha cephalotaxi]SFF93870.1 Predicted flavoprotein CzcO associated with the cation diffusion facilitator CzcD [Actinopolymorpha cephalotaxi]